MATPGETAAPVTMVMPTSNLNKDDIFLMKLSQAVMMGIGFLAIWGGVFSVAFDEDATNQNFFVLFVGGLASFAVSIALIEFQSKKNDYQLYDIQNYFLGIAFFFSTVGVLWGTRYLMGIATGTLELSWFGDPSAYNGGVDWSPNANGIYAQTVMCLVLTYGHYRLLNRYSGDTGFGWGVATYAPMAILLAGVGPWIRWSGNEVSYELGISIFVITLVSLEMALRSNKALNFVVIAFASGIVPIVYEILNTSAPVDGEGGALSLLVFIIGLQGYYAARQDLRKEVMERASVLLIGQVVVAIALARNADFNLILGPFRSGDFTSLDSYVSIPVALWVAVLFAYFPAVLQQRVPWMPIGLAVALMALPMDQSTIPWILSMIVIPYMVFISKVAREWVVNITLLAFSASYLLTDWWGISEGIPASESFGGTPYMHVIIPIFIIAVSEFGRRTEKLRVSTTLAMLGSVVMSRAILDPEWYLPWMLVAYMLFVNFSMLQTTPNPTLKHRKDATLSILFTTITVLLLAFLDELQLPPGLNENLVEGFRPQFLVLSFALYFISVRSRAHEFDFGTLLHWFGSGSPGGPRYDIDTETWVVEEMAVEELEAAFDEKAWTPLARPSVILSLMLFGFSISLMSSLEFIRNAQWVLLMMIPAAMLVREITAMETISSNTRAAGVGLLILLALPLAMPFKEAAVHPDLDGQLFIAAIILDSILMIAPLVVNAVISRRGIDLESVDVGADRIAYGLLLLLACLDSSGGLLLVPLVLLVVVRTVKHRLYEMGMFVPIVYLVLGQSWWNNGIAALLLDIMPIELYDYLTDYHLGPFPAFIGALVGIQMGLTMMIMNKDDSKEPAFTEVAAALWLGLGLLSALPDGYWIPTIFTLALMPYLWYTNNAKALPYTLGVLFVSLFIGFDLSDTFPSIRGADSWGWSGLLTGVAGSAMMLLHTREQLFRTPPENEDDSRSQEDTAALTTQLAAVGYIIGYSVFFGIGPLVGLAMLSYSALRKGQINSMLLLPVLVTFSVVNLMVQSDIGTTDQQTTVAGLVLAVQGIMFTLLSAKDDLVYDWEQVSWPSDEVFFNFMDRLGIGGLSYSLVGIFMCLNTVDLDSIAFLLMTMYLVFIGVQGFSEETDARWRRGLGGYGSILTAFLFANSLDNDLFSALGIVVVGIISLGFGFLFMQRMNEDDAIYVEEEIQGGTATYTAPPEEIEEEDAPEMINLPDVEDEEIFVVEDEPEEDHNSTDETPEEMDDDEEVELVEEAEMRETEVEATAAVVQHSGLLETDGGFFVRLPTDAVNNIISSLNATPHEGYKPVVAFGPTGQIMLTFE